MLGEIIFSSLPKTPRPGLSSLYLFCLKVIRGGVRTSVLDLEQLYPVYLKYLYKSLVGPGNLP